jgi:hypothetical protein
MLNLVKSLVSRRRPPPAPARRARLNLEQLEDRFLLDGNPPISFTVVNDWQSGFQGAITIGNDRPVNIVDWRLEFDAAFTITQIWNGRILNHTGNHYVVTHDTWNSTIPPGGTASFGFVGSPGNNPAAPTNYVFSDSGSSTPGPSPLTLTVGDITVQEGNSGTANAVFTVLLSAASSQTVTVNYATANSTATAGSDYQAVSGTLTFLPGQTQKTVPVAVYGDTTVEPTEAFFLQLTNAVNATLADNQARGTLLNDDGLPAPAFNYGEALQKALFFYDAQRSGDLPANFRIDWRGDAAMNDGADVGLDLTGGFWDAGDHVKFVLPMASSMTLLTWGLLQYRDAYQQSGQLSYLQDIIKWGADWLVKAHPSPNVFYAQVGNGDLDHAFWGAPEVMPMARPAYKVDPTKPGSDVAAEAAAALSAASLVFRSTDPAYADQLLQHAIELFIFADTYRGKYSDSIPQASFYPSSGYFDELAWGAAWLYKATGNSTYLTKAESIYGQNFAGQTWTWTHAWDDKRYGTGILLAQLTGKPGYRIDVERWLDYWTVGLSGGATRVTYTSGGLAWLNGWGSLRYASTTAFLALVYSDTLNDYGHRYHDFAVNQMNYLLGQNPNNRSYVVGFGNNPPQFPHHRGASGVWDGNVDNPTPNRHVLYGALVGGPESPNDNDYQDVRGDYISNEVALDYNAGFTGALARLFWEYRGQPLASFPIPDVRDDEFFVEAKINQQTDRFTEIQAQLNNRSAWPARASTNLSFRYFVNLSEVYAAGYTVSDIEVVSNYSQGAQVSGLLPWDANQHLYYVDVRFQGVEIVPGPGTFRKAAQVRVGLKNGVPSSAWDPTNDWSYQGLLATGPEQKTAYLPVYEGSTKLFGQLPAAPGTPALSINDVTIVEGNAGTRQAVFTVSLLNPSTQTVTVQYATMNVTAQAGQDYTATSGTLTFAPGVTSRTIIVTILSDTLIEGNETFKVVLSNPVGAVLSRSMGIGTIQDDDAPAAPISAQFIRRDDWGAGFVADLVITNNGSTNINGWTLEFDLAAQITNIWNALILSHVGDHYVIGNAAWNGTILAGQSITFGFQGAPGGGSGPTNYRFNGTPLP